MKNNNNSQILNRFMLALTAFVGCGIVLGCGQRTPVTLNAKSLSSTNVKPLNASNDADLAATAATLSATAAITVSSGLSRPLSPSFLGINTEDNYGLGWSADIGTKVAALNSKHLRYPGGVAIA